MRSRGAELLKLASTSLIFRGTDAPVTSSLRSGRRALYFRTNSSDEIIGMYVSLDGTEWLEVETGGGSAGTAVAVQYAETDSDTESDWHDTQTDDDEYLRLGIGDPVAYTPGIPLSVVTGPTGPRGLQGLPGADGQDAWSASTQIPYTPFASFSGQSGNRWTHNPQSGHDHVEINTSNANDKRLLAHLLAGGKMRVRNVAGDTISVFAYTDATHLSGDHYRLTGEFDEDAVTFSQGTNYHLDFTQARSGAPGEDGISPDAVPGGQGAQGIFTKRIYMNSASEPLLPSDATYTVATKVFSDIASGWSETPSNPSSTQRTYRLQAEIDPDTDDATIDVAWTGLLAISGRDGEDGEDSEGGGGATLTQIKESVTFQQSAAVTGSTPIAAINTAATDPISVIFPPGGDAEILSVTAGESNITVAKAGVYGFNIVGIVNVSSDRPIPYFEIYDNDDTIGTDTPLGRASGQYVRGEPTDQLFYAIGEVTILADNTQIKLSTWSLGRFGTDPAYQIDAGMVMAFYLSGVKGDKGDTGAAGGGGGIAFILPANVGGTGDAITLAQDTADTEYAEGKSLRFVAEAANTVTGVTIDLDGLGAISLVDSEGDALAVGALSNGTIVDVTYDRSRFIATNIHPSTATDISGKANVGLGNVADDISDEDQEAFRDKVGAVSEGDVENIAAERVQHVIRRRLVETAGVLQVGDARIDSGILYINNHDDTADGWFNDLPVGTRIKIRGQTSGAVRIGTVDSVSVSGDDAQLTVTFTVSTGTLANHETVVITFDAVHNPQSDALENNPDAPDFIRNKQQFWLTASEVSRSGNVYTLSPTPAITTLIGGMTFAWRLATSNTGAVTVIVSSLSAVSVRKSDGTEFASGEMPGNGRIEIKYDGDHDVFLSDVDPPSEAGEATDISGKADTDLGNVADDISDDDQEAFRDKVGAISEDDIPESGIISLESTEVSRSGNNFTLSPDPAITALTHGLTFGWQLSGTTNSGAVGVIVSSLSPLAVRKRDGTQFASGELPTGGWIFITYDAGQNLFVSDIEPTKANPNLQNILSTMTASQQKTVRSRLDAQKQLAVHNQNFRNAPTTGRYVASSGNPNSIISAKLAHDSEIAIAETDGTVDFSHNNLRGNFYIANDVYNSNDNAGWQFTFVNTAAYDIHILPTDDTPRFVIEGALGPVERVAYDPDDHANSHPIILKQGQWVRLIFLSSDGTTHTFFGIGGGSDDPITSEPAEVEGDLVASLELTNSDGNFPLLSNPSEVSQTSFRDDGWTLGGHAPDGTEAFHHGIASNPRLRIPLKRPAVNVLGLIFKVLTLDEISTLSGGINATTTSIVLGSAPDDALAVNDIIQIRYEKVKITARHSNTVFTMERGVDDTDAVAHSSGAVVFAGEHEMVDESTHGWGSTARYDDDGNAVQDYGLSYVAADPNIYLRFVKPPTRNDAHIEAIFYPDSDGVSVPKRTKLEVYLAMVADNLDVGQEDVQILAGNHINVTTDGAGNYTVAVSTAHATQAEMEAGDLSAIRQMSPENIDQAIQALAPGAPPVLFLYGAGQDDANQPEFFPRRDLGAVDGAASISVVKFNPTPQRKLNGAEDRPHLVC